MKIVALSFLLGAAVIFLLCSWLQSRGDAGPWVGYVRAAAEAGMVGALADWFAVTALFKHPLGIPIPHTAIIKRKKDQLGEGLSTFVRENFLSADNVETKLRSADVASRTGKWLAEPVNADRVAAEASTVLRALVEMLRDDDVQQVLDRMIVKRIAEPQWGPPIGRVLASLLEAGRQEALIQLLADRAFEWSLNAGEVIERVIERDSPSWSPRWVDTLIGDRIHRELMDFTDKVRRNPDHELRRSATKFLFEFAADLQNDEATIQRAENVKNQIMARDEVTRAAETAWTTAKRILMEAVDDPSSTLRARIADAVVHIGESLRDDSDLRDNENVPLPPDPVRYEPDPTDRLATDTYAKAVEQYVEQEVHPFVPDAWVDHTKTKIGYEIPLTRHFYVYTSPRPLEEIDDEIKQLEQEIQELLREVTE